MKEIIYKGKKVKVPFEDADYNLDGEKDVVIENRFGGEKATVPGYAAAVYDYTISSNLTAETEDEGKYWGYSQHWAKVRKGIDWFRRHFAKEYMVLLD